jgi:hypothetical protein
VTQAAVGAALGISQPAVAQLKRRGMPCDRIEAAQAWHKRNVKPRQRRVRRTRAASPETPDAVADAATASTTLQELADLRAIARRGLAAAETAEDDYSLRAWTLAQSKILAQSAETEERLLAIAKDQGQLLTVGQAREAFGSVLKDVRKLLDAAPGALAAKVNPGDPDHSRAIIEDWVRGVLRTLHRGEASEPGP